MDVERIESKKYMRSHKFAASIACDGKSLGHKLSIGSRDSRALPMIANVKVCDAPYLCSALYKYSSRSLLFHVV
jgi:hypothetical protein